ncbi:low molecular weight phosphatase family protein [Nesterenkonia aurantiaca]|uniref:arsenate reductase/protein-tyrosine-phosphatase family protein n=1 Tax=Nesterenkonia aurantiaca TaxID=1436010 RepID=UPI003EE4562B
MSDVFRVLVVCTGNICRSAQAEQLIRARVAENFPQFESVIAVESAGTAAMVGAEMPAEAAALSMQYGGAPADHAARQLTVAHVREADLVLAMAAEHRSAVVRLLPRAARNTFMLTEFAALLENVEQNHAALAPGVLALTSADKLRSAVKWTSGRRGYLQPADATLADVIDPFRRSEEVYSESARQIVDALSRTQRAAVNLAHRVDP